MLPASELKLAASATAGKFSSAGRLSPHVQILASLATGEPSTSRSHSAFYRLVRCVTIDSRDVRQDLGESLFSGKTLARRASFEVARFKRPGGFGGHTGVGSDYTRICPPTNQRHVNRAPWGVKTTERTSQRGPPQIPQDDGSRSVQLQNQRTGLVRIDERT